MENQMIFKRYELKYLLTRQQQEEILRAMAPYMEPDRFGHSTIRNLYYDTPDFLLVRNSLDKPIYKEKLRVRSYGRADSNSTVFVELKKKYESIVYKRRVALSSQSAAEWLVGLGAMPDNQIGREIQATLNRYRNLAPRVYLSYERDAYRCIQGSGFRVTFDSSIRYRTEDVTLDSDNRGAPLLDSNAVLMELKIPESMPLWMARELSRLGIYKTTFSKYGTAYRKMLYTSRIGEPEYA